MPIECAFHVQIDSQIKAFLRVRKLLTSLSCRPYSSNPNLQIETLSSFAPNPKHYTSTSTLAHPERSKRPSPLRRSTSHVVTSTTWESRVLVRNKKRSVSLSMPVSKGEQCPDWSYRGPLKIQAVHEQLDLYKSPRTSGGDSALQRQRLPSKETELEKHNLVSHNTPQSGIATLPRGSENSSQTRPSNTNRRQGLSRLTSSVPTHKLATHQRPLRSYLEPPVTLQILAELELYRFVNNPKLRHDINLDLDLHFRPNFDGKKGAEKKHKAKLYWQALADAFDACASGSPQAFQVELVEVSLETVREILKTLLPDRDHMALSEVLDIDMLLQQIRRKQYNFVGLAQWLSKLLKTHCAPMRDEMVDEMVDQVLLGAKNHNTRAFVDGLCRLFGVMEAMKLVSCLPFYHESSFLTQDKDIANHQIRSLRHLLVEDSVNFEQRYILHRIAKREIDTNEAIRWLQAEALPSRSGSSNSNDNWRNIFFSRLLSSMDPSNSIKLPHSTFSFDIDRLYNIQQEVLDLVRLRTCHQVYGKFVFGFEVEANHSSFALIHNWTEAALSDVCNTDRWTESAKIVFVEVSRRLSDHSLESTAEEQIMQGINSQSAIFDTSRKEINQNLELLTRAYAKKYMTLAPGAIAGSWDVSKMKSTLPIYWYLLHDLARRLAHIGLLHWRIWAPLVYSKSR